MAWITLLVIVAFVAWAFLELALGGGDPQKSTSPANHNESRRTNWGE